MKRMLIIMLLLGYTLSYAQDTVFIKVHFIYGSKPLLAYRYEEFRWFGGVLGGHVGIEYEQDKIISFLPKGHFHKVAHPNDRHSFFAGHSVQQFYHMFGTHPDSVKKAVVVIPITLSQKHKLDSVVSAYKHETPYDYAFIGMRCGAAAYEILSRIGVLKSYSIKKTYKKIFYPRLFRKILFKVAAENGWEVNVKAGTPRRKWDKD